MGTTGKAKELHGNIDREKEITNSIANSSIILMGTMMGTFAEAMVKATGTMASGMAEAMGGEEAGEKVNKELNEKLPEVDEKMKAMISDMRKDIYAQLEQKRNEIKPLLSDSVFDAGPKIIGKYDFKLPKLTKELDDIALAQYMRLLVSQDPNFLEMFKKLSDWMKTLPKFPDKTQKG